MRGRRAALLAALLAVATVSPRGAWAEQGQEPADDKSVGDLDPADPNEGEEPDRAGHKRRSADDDPNLAGRPVADDEPSPDTRPDAGGDAGDAGSELTQDAGPRDAGVAPRGSERAGKGEAPAATPRAVDLATEPALREHLEARARALRAGDLANAEVELGLLLDARAALGVRNVIVASAALMREANSARAQGRLDQAIQLADTAAVLSPDLSSAHWLRARLYIAQDWTQLARIAHPIGDLVHAKLHRFRNTVALIANVIAMASLALLSTILAFTLIQLLKYLRYPGFDLVRLLPSWFGAGEGVLLLAIAIVSPLVLGLGVAAAIVIALVAVYAYQTPKERFVSMSALALLATAPGVVYVLAPFVTFHGSIADAMETVMSEAFATDAEQKLTEFSRGPGRGDIECALLLAHRDRMRGDLGAAELEYKRAIAAQPGNTAARNNLGTLLYLLGRDEAAMATFQAASNGGDRAEPLLNLASILLDRSRFDEANAAIEKARLIDPDLAARYAAHESGRPTVERLLYAQMDQGILWSRLFEVDGGRRAAVMDETWKTIGGITPPLAMPGYVLLAAAVMLLLARRAEALGLSVACPKCGMPAHRDAPSLYCDQCQSIFLKAVAVEPFLRIAKEEAVRSYQRRRKWTERVLSIFAGAGLIFSGSPFLGMGLLTILGVAASAIWFSEGFIVHPWSVGIDPSSMSVQVAAGVAVAFVLFLVSVRSSFR